MRALQIIAFTCCLAVAAQALPPVLTSTAALLAQERSERAARAPPSPSVADRSSAEDLARSRQRRTLYIDGGNGIQINSFWPNKSKRLVVGKLRRVVALNDNVFQHEFVTNQNADIVFESEDARHMTKSTSESLDKLAKMVLTWFEDETKLAVLAGWQPDSTGATDLSLQFEGRELSLGLYHKGALNGSFPALQLLADLAYYESGFDFIFLDWTTSTPFVRASKSFDGCASQHDIAFLMDGSSTVTASGYQQEKDFVKQVALALDLQESRVSIGTFEGPRISHFSISPTYADCPPGTEFEAKGLGCMCPIGSQCYGQQYDTRTKRGCRIGLYSPTNQCPTTAAEYQAYVNDPSTFPTCVERSFFTHLVSPKSYCNPLGPIYKAEDSADIHLRFDQPVTETSLTTLLDGLTFPDGAAHLSVGVQFMRQQVFNTSNGMRPAASRIPRVLCVLIEDRWHHGFDPSAELYVLEQTYGVKVFAIGMGGKDLEDELLQMASQPKDAHVFMLDAPTGLRDVVQALSNDICTTPINLAIGTTAQVTDFPLTDLHFYELECSVTTAGVDVWVTDAAGTTTNVYVSYVTQNPTAISNNGKDTSGDKTKIITVTKASSTSPLHIAVENVGSGTDGYEVVGYSRVFTTVALEVDLLEHPDENTEVVAALPQGAHPTFPNTPDEWEYSLQGDEDGSFVIDPVSGAITVSATGKAALDREATAEVVLRRFAKNKVIGCLVGYQTIFVHLVDINDNRPVFVNGDATITLDEFVPRRIDSVGRHRRMQNGDTVYTFEVMDPDGTTDITIKFDEIDSGNSLGAFDLEGGNVVIKDVTKISFEQTNMFVLQFRASDAAGDSLVSTLTIVLTDVFEPPFFAIATTNNVAATIVKVNKNLNVGLIATFPFVSDDIDENGQIATCEILAGNSLTYFVVARNGMTCELRATFASFQQIGTFNLRVSITQGTSRDEFVQPVDVRADNLKGPLFSKNRFTVRHSDHAPEGSVVIAFKEPELSNQGDGDIITCEIISDVPAPAGEPLVTLLPPCTLVTLQVFKDAYGSSLAVPSPIDVRIKATDSGYIPLSDEATVRIATINGCPVDGCDPNEIETPTDYSCPGSIGFVCVCLSSNQADCPGRVDHCATAGNPCKNGGTCRNFNTATKVGYECTCAEGFYGTNCDQVVNACEANPCENGGTCTRTELIPGSGFFNGFRCTCATGFYQARCTMSDENEPSACDLLTEPCKNNGVCVRAPNPRCDQTTTNCPRDYFACECPANTAGDRCEMHKANCFDEDDGDLCQNDGVCVATIQGGECQCASGYFGDLCDQYDTSACNGKLCNGRGTCETFSPDNTLPQTDYKCVCDLDSNGDRIYTGKDCELPVGTENFCDPDPCQGNGVCIESSTGADNVADGFYCVCRTGCNVLDANDCSSCTFACDSLSCANGGVCSPDKNGGSCECPADTCWTGYDCQSSDCSLVGTCVQGTCSCPSGTIGEKCEGTDETTPNACESGPCQNGGTCVRASTSGLGEALDSFYCACTEQFTGQDCGIAKATEPFCHENSCVSGNGFCVEVDLVGSDNTADNYMCVCRSNCGGQRCDVCDDNCKVGNVDQCNNGGQCQKTTEGGQCQCADPTTVTDTGLNGEPVTIQQCYFGPTCAQPIQCPTGVTAVQCAYVDETTIELLGDLLNQEVCVAASQTERKENSAAAATVAGSVVGVVVLCCIVALLLFVLAGRRRTVHKTEPVMEVSNAMFVPPFMDVHGLDNPMYGMTTNASIEAGYSELPMSATMVANNPLYFQTNPNSDRLSQTYDDLAATQAALGFDRRNFALERGALRMSSVRRSNPLNRVGVEHMYDDPSGDYADIVYDAADSLGSVTYDNPGDADEPVYHTTQDNEDIGYLITDEMQLRKTTEAHNNPLYSAF